MMKQKFYPSFMKLLLVSAFMMLMSASALADGVSKTVALTEAGSLSSLLTDDEKATVTDLTVSGPINYSDVNTMVTMGKEGVLSVLDMSEATPATTDLIYENRFQNCEKFTSVSLPKGITSIGNQAFAGCSNLTSVTIPDGVKSIGTSAFQNCSSLTAVTIPDDVEKINVYTFANCSALTSVTIGKSVETIDMSAFAGCSNLAEVTLKGDTPPTCNTNAFDNIPSGATLYCLIGKANACEKAAWWSNFTNIEASVIVLDSGEHLSAYITDDNKTTFTTLKIFGEINSSDISLLSEMADLEHSGTLSILDMSGATAESKDLISDKAFYRCFKLTSLSLPQGITSIGSYALAYCANMTSLTFPNSVTTIDNDAFTLCKGLTSVNIPDGVKSIGQYAFSFCSRLISVTIPASVTNIDDAVFWGCTALNRVTLLGNALPTTCAENIFKGIDVSKDTLFCSPALNSTCHATAPWSGFGAIVTAVTLADEKRLSAYITDDIKATVTGLKVYGKINSSDISFMADMANDGALGILDMSEATPESNDLISAEVFKNCKKLISISLPQGITSIGESAFYQCANLAYITIPSSATSIGDNAFYSCSSLTSITIPNSVTSIGKNALCRCSNLTSITIPNSVTSIGEGAFQNCSSLASVSIPNSVTSIGDGAFQYCSSLASIYIPNSVTSIGEGLFQNCSSLASVSIPNSVTSIGKGAFKNCSSLASISIPNSVTSIGTETFGDCTALTKVSLRGKALPTTCAEDAFVNISSDAILDCDLTLESSCQTTAPWSGFTTIIPTVTLADGKSMETYISDDIKATLTKLKVYGDIDLLAVKFMADMAKNGALSILDISEASAISPYLIDTRLFEGCTKLTSIDLPKGIIWIGDCAFQNCSNLVSVNLPNSVTDIDNRAFQNCSSLASITLPKSTTSISGNAFYGCSSLTSITIPGKVREIGAYAFQACSNLTSVVFENGVQRIASYAFVACTKLTTVTIPNSVTYIGDLAFFRTGLTSVTIPGNVKELNYCAFQNCANLASVVIEDGVQNIGEMAFQNCPSLTSITFPKSVTSIGEKAFKDCSLLGEVTLQGDALPTCGDNVFANIKSGATLYCEPTLVETCKNTAPWNAFANITAAQFSVTISDAGIATACSNKDLDLSEVTGIKAYIAVGFNPDNGKVLLTNVTHIPAGTGFIVKGDAGTYHMPMSTANYTYANMLVGTLAETTLSASDATYSYYVLGNDATTGLGFYAPDDGYKLPANKAYLRIPTNASQAKMAIGLSFDDEDDTTGFIPVKELFKGISGNSAVYDLNGRRKQSLTKGLNIVNGKKIFVK